MMTTFLYSAVVLVAVLLGFKAKMSKSGGHHQLFWLILLLSVVSGLRNYTVGTDSERYTHIFFNYGHWYDTIEYGFELYVSSLMKVWYNPSFVFMVTSLITNTLFVIGFWKFRDRISFPFSVFSYCIYIYFLTFSGVRQWLAVSIVFYGSTLLIKKKYKLFIIITLLTSFIHSSAVVGLIILGVVLFYKYKLNNTIVSKILILSPILVTFILITYKYLFSEYNNILDENNFNAASLGMMVFVQLINLMTILICFRKYDSNKGENYIFVNSCLTISFIYQICCFSGYFLNNVARIGWYYLPFEVLIFSYVWKLKNKEKLYFYSSLLIIFLMLYSFFTMCIYDGIDVIPYRLSEYIF